MIVSLLALAFLVALFFFSGRGLLNAAFVLLSFGTLASIPPEMIGGTTVLASSLAFMLLVGRQLILKDQPQRLASGLIDYKALAPLTVFTFIAVIGAFILPRAFDESVMVYPMRGGEISFAVPLGPTSSNFNQALNQIVNMGVVAAFFAMSRLTGFTKRMKDAFIWGAIAVIATGIADIVLTAAGLSSVLELFRTASYVLMDDSEVNGMRRAIGLMSESSSFGAIATSMGALLLFCRNAYAPGDRLIKIFPLAGACLALAVLSTSSTAYGAMAVLGALHGADIAWRLVFAGAKYRRALYTEIGLSLAFVLLAICVILVWDAARETIIEMLDAVIFKKTQSSSYLERSAWTNQGIEAFFATNGIGVGVGSVRTSNFFVNILASTGILGAALFSIFTVRVFAARIPSKDAVAFELAHGSKLTLLVTAVAMYLAGTTPDYGVLVGALFGMIVGLATRKKSSADVAYSPEPAPEGEPKRRLMVERL